MKMRTLRLLIQMAGPGGSPLVRKCLLHRIRKEAAHRLKPVKKQLDRMAAPWNRESEPSPWAKGALWTAAAVAGTLIAIRLGRDSGRTGRLLHL